MNKREIKFRTWNPVCKKFFYGAECCLYQGESGLEAKVTWNGICADQLIQQYTNLNDKNGKEIYEGDICKYYRPKIALVVYPEENGEILWEDNTYYFRHKDNKFKWIISAAFCKDSLEIVGNIFENPELLK